MLQTVESALQTVYDGLTITPAFDGLAQSILITKITVPEHHNLVFRFIDGSIYRYRMTAATPKSKPGAYERKQKTTNAFSHFIIKAPPLLNLHEYWTSAS